MQHRGSVSDGTAIPRGMTRPAPQIEEEQSCTAASATTVRRRRSTIPSERRVQLALRTILAGRGDHRRPALHGRDRGPGAVMERGLIVKDAPRPA